MTVFISGNLFITVDYCAPSARSRASLGTGSGDLLFGERTARLVVFESGAVASPFCSGTGYNISMIRSIFLFSSFFLVTLTLGIFFVV